MKPDEGLQLPIRRIGQRHVLAAAIRGRANVIVIANLRDFPAKILRQFGIEAQSPDKFTRNCSHWRQALVAQRHGTIARV